VARNEYRSNNLSTWNTDNLSMKCKYVFSKNLFYNSFVKILKQYANIYLLTFLHNSKKAYGRVICFVKQIPILIKIINYPVQHWFFSLLGEDNAYLCTNYTNASTSAIKITPVIVDYIKVSTYNLKFSCCSHIHNFKHAKNI